MWLHKLKTVICSLFYPPKCICCKKVLKSNEIFCDKCASELKVKPIIRDFDLFDGINLRAVSAFSYEDKVKEAICDFKFKNKLDYAKFFAKSVADSLEKTGNIGNFEYICCVPMSKENKKERGYNQAEVLAKSIGKILKLPFKDVLFKAKRTKTQHTLARDERIINVKGAYSVLNKEEVKDKNVLLCDDILTTGSTIKECAMTLYNASAKKVFAVCIASRD